MKASLFLEEYLLPLPLIPSRQGTGNLTSYKCINIPPSSGPTRSPSSAYRDTLPDSNKKAARFMYHKGIAAYLISSAWHLVMRFGKLDSCGR
jgi:hypothetical protein